MAAKKETTEARVRAAAPARGSRGKTREGAFFPVSPLRAGLPRDYAETLSAIKQRIQAERQRVVMAANAAMVLFYWDIGRMILERQERAGWGAKVIDRLSADLRAGLPGHEGVLAAQPEVHARVCRGVAGAGNRARGSCTNSLVSPQRPLGEARRTPPYGSGMPGRRWSTAGRTTSWCCRSRAAPTNARARRSPTSRRPCRPPSRPPSPSWEAFPFQAQTCLAFLFPPGRPSVVRGCI